MDVTPQGNLVKIAMASGSTLYFDRGIFQSNKKNSVFFHIYTVAGQNRFSPLRKKLFLGTDGVVFVADSQRSRWDDNVESLKELKKVAEGGLITKIPLVIMLNKRDLPDIIDESEFEQLLRDEGLYFDPPHELSMWNPMIYETVALYNQERAVYKSFTECARRASLYSMYGEGSAPAKGEIKMSDKVPDL